MSAPITTPGLGGGGGPVSTRGSTGGSVGSSSGGTTSRATGGVGGVDPTAGDTTIERDGPAAAASTVDEAMRDAELKLAERENREHYEREKRRRIVDEQTKGKLARIAKGTSEHFEVLALRQKWTLPLDDDDYRLWMQRQLLAEHRGALAAEVSQRRRHEVKAAARGPLIVVGIVTVLGLVAGVGWWIGSGGDAVEPAASSRAAVEAAPPATATATGAAPAADAPTGVASATAVPSAAPASPPAAVTGGSTSTARPPASPPARPPATGGPKKDIWEREF